MSDEVMGLPGSGGFGHLARKAAALNHALQGVAAAVANNRQNARVCPWALPLEFHRAEGIAPHEAGAPPAVSIKHPYSLLGVHSDERQDRSCCCPRCPGYRGLRQEGAR